jgi:hypothetical protein
MFPHRVSLVPFHEWKIASFTEKEQNKYLRPGKLWVGGSIRRNTTSRKWPCVFEKLI